MADSMDTSPHKLNPLPSVFALTEEQLSGFLCPITGEIMQDPVITVSDGQSYERTAVAEWFKSGCCISPVSGQPLQNQQQRLAGITPGSLKRISVHRT